jgi:hypothetical protein
MSTGADRNPFPVHLLCAALVAGATFFLASCKESPVEPLRNSPPNSTLEVSPLSGVSPLEVRIRGRATDPDGIEDIASYKTVIRNSVNSDSLVFTKNPMDTTLTLTTPSGIEKTVYNIKSRAVDKKGAENSKETNVEVYHPLPSVSQKATLQDRVNIKYEATIKNLNEAHLDVSKNGSAILSRTIKDPGYSEIFSYSGDTSITKGNYDFVLKWKTLAGKDTSNTTSMSIPNYYPDLDFSGLQAEMDEGGEVILDLESLLENADTNPEDNPVPLISATSLDGKTSESINGKIINVKSLVDKVGDYKVAIQIGSDAGEKNTRTLNGVIYDLLDIEGFLEDNEQHLRQPGIVRVYDGEIDIATGKNRRLGEINVNSLGEFSSRFNYRVKDLVDSLLISGRKIENGIERSYVRTIKLPRADQRGLTLRVVPYDGLAENGISVGDFKKSMLELFPRGVPTRFDFDGEFIKDIPGFRGLEGIEILSHDPRGTQYGVFTPEEQNRIKNKILDQSDINGIIGNYRIKPEQILIGNRGNFTLDSTQQVYSIIPKQGWIIFAPNSVMPVAGFADKGKLGKLVSRGTIYVAPDALFNMGVFSHEAGHMFLGDGHITSINPDKSIMNVSTGLSTISTTGPADKKAGKMIYEPTFMVFPQTGYPHVDNLENLLGLKWADE